VADFTDQEVFPQAAASARSRRYRQWPKELVEVGCGNGRFLRAVSERVEKATGLDWAVSPLATDLPPNVSMLRMDVLKEPIPKADLICSADVLEHFPPDRIDEAVKKAARSGPQEFSCDSVLR